MSHRGALLCAMTVVKLISAELKNKYIDPETRSAGAKPHVRRQLFGESTGEGVPDLNPHIGLLGYVGYIGLKVYGVRAWGTTICWLNRAWGAAAGGTPARTLAHTTMFSICI